MKNKGKDVSKSRNKSAFSTGMYVAAIGVAMIGVALLVNNIYLFKNTVNQYVTQGYPTATVMKELIPSMLPGMFEPIAVYGGIAFLLFGVGKVNKKVSKCLLLLAKVEVSSDIIEENIVELNAVDLKNTEESKHTETLEEAIKI